MAMRSIKRKKQSSQAGFARQTIQSDILEGIIKIPRSLKHRMVEVILLPVDTEMLPLNISEEGVSPLGRFAGAWSGEPLVREEQGTYEVREEVK